MQKVFVVAHTHWDREWYFTAAQSKVLLLETLPVVLEELENGDLPCFVLDGQTSLLEDYLGFAPQERDRIKSLVRAGKLLIGPWYTQTDQCVVAGESIARNLLYGIRDSQPFGGHMEIGYVPDSFGQTAQLPQILRQFGIKRCVFGRGLWEGISPESEFLWESGDGSRVTTAALLSGYSGIKGMPEGDGKAARRIEQLNSHAKFMRPFNASANTLVMGGNDQQPWDPELPAVLEAENARQSGMQYRLSGFEEFFNALELDADLKSVQGEMLAGKYGRIHRGIWSTRYDIKKANADIERLITHSLEPLLTIGWALGMQYPHGLLESCWKLLLKSHAHDSIGCCNSDEVNQLVKQRFEIAARTCQQQLELRMRQIAQQIQADRSGELVLIFNTLPEVRNELVDIEVVVAHESPANISLLDSDGRECAIQSMDVTAVPLSSLVQDLDAALAPGETGDPMLFRHRLLVDAGKLPPLGYKTLYLQSNERSNTGPGLPDKLPAADTIENQHLRVQVASDGTLRLTQLASGREMSGLLELVDGGDDGDNYDFSPPRKDWLVSSLGQAPEIRVEEGPLKRTMHLRFQMDLPADLEERARRQTSLSMPVEVILTLQQDQKYLDVRIELENTARDHRLQAVFRTGLKTDVSYADQPFGMIRRPGNPPELDEWQSEGWTSKPLPLYPMQSYVALSNGSTGLAIMTDGIREYEIDGGGTLAITLYRSVGRMGKPDLLYRPGRLSGMPTPTPDSQMTGSLVFHFALLPFEGAADSVAKAARRYLCRPDTFHLGSHHRFSINRGTAELPAAFSLATLHGPLVVSAIKKAEQEDAFIIRAFNPSLDNVDGVQLASQAADGTARQVTSSNMNEDQGQGEPLPDGCLPEQVAPQQIVNFMVHCDQSA